MAQRAWVSTTLIILLAITAGAGIYFYQSLYSDLRQLDSAHQEALSEAERLQQELSLARQRLTQRSTSADRLEAQLNQAQQSLVTAAKELEALQGQIENLEGRIHDLDERLSASQTLASDRGDQLAQSQARIAELDSRIASLDSSRQELENALSAAREQQAQNEVQIDKLSEELEATRATLAQAQDQLAQKESTLEEVAKERQSVAEQYREAREQLALQQARSRSASETVKELEARLQRERSAMNNLQTRLQALSNEKQTLVSRLEDGTTIIKLPESIVFNSGSARIGKSGRETLQLLTTALESFPDHLISVQGHSDSLPISPSLQDRYLTNWELSAARAASAVRVLRDNGIAPERMQAVGYADTRPLVKETDAASRRMNRRIEVLLYPDQFNVKAHSGLTTH